MTALSRYLKRLAEAERKGLDLSPEGRAKRAKEQGYFTNQDLHNLLSQEPKVEIKKSTSRGDPKDYMDLFVNNQRVEQGRQSDIDRYLNYNYEYFSPVSVQRDGLKREAYVKVFPGKYEKGYADFSMDDLLQLYHGTVGDIQSFNPNMLGKNTNAGSAREATFMSNLPEDAKDYANIAYQGQPKQRRANEILTELNYKKGEAEKFIERFKRYNMDQYGGKPEDLEAAQRRIDRMLDRMRRVAPAADDSYKASYPLVTRMENPMLVDNRNDGYGNITENIKSAKERGHDAVVFFDINDPNPHATHVAAFDPSKIRSKFAIFDPDHINSRDLLAGVGGAAALGTELDNLEEPEGYASGGVVKKGSSALKELLENLHKSDPERMKRAEEAGFDTSRIWLRGRSDTSDFFDPKMGIDNRIHMTEDPELASRYAFSSVIGKEFENIDDPNSPFLNEEISANLTPVFIKKAKVIDADGKNWDQVHGKKYYEDQFPKNKPTILENIYDEPGDDYFVSLSFPQHYEFIKDSYRRQSGPANTSFTSRPKDIKSIFNDFSPDSLKKKEFASGGVVKPARRAMESLFLEGKQGSLLNDVGGMEVLKNPSYRDLLKLAQESEMSDDIGEKAVRLLKDPEGNLYAWPSAYLDHQSIADEVAPGFDFYGKGASDNFIFKNGKLHSYNLGEEHGHESIPQDLNSERIKKFLSAEPFAEGGLVESTKAFGRGALHGGTMAADEPLMALIGSAYAKATRPELFEDLSYEDLVDVALANQAAERAAIEEEHPYAYLAGELASGAIPIAMGGSLPTQMLNSAAMSGLYGFNEAPNFEQGLEDAAIDAGIGAAVPVAFSYGSKALPLAPLLMGADSKKVVFQE